MAHLTLQTSAGARAGSRPKAPSGRMSDYLIRQNAVWDIQLRWIVVSLLLLLGTFSNLLSTDLERIGLVPQPRWPFAVAGLLIALNLFYRWILSRKRISSETLHRNIWMQIVLDLMVLTVVIHYLGALLTPAPFLYSLHIVLACLFLPMRGSIIAVLLSVFFYLTLVSIELATRVGLHSVFLWPGTAAVIGSAKSVLFVGWVSATCVFLFIIWYLVSRLSEIIRLRERQLIEAGLSLREAQRQKDQRIVMMTHELKSPLDSIRSGLSVVAAGHYGAVPEPLETVCREIESRVQQMSVLVLDVLKLSRVRLSDDEGTVVPVGLGQIIKGRIDSLAQKIRESEIEMRIEIPEVKLVGKTEYLEMLFDNLLANAVTYSQRGGVVSVSGTMNAGGELIVTVADQGIGINAQELPHIFDEYYHTAEAVHHNPLSTGVGLAIVKQIAERFGIGIEVESEPGRGSSFTLTFPASCVTATAAVPA
jgi:signal transduction histidine kinase